MKFFYNVPEREGVVVGLDQGRLGGEDPEVGGRQEHCRFLNRTLGTNIKVTLIFICHLGQFLDEKALHN